MVHTYHTSKLDNSVRNFVKSESEGRAEQKLESHTDIVVFAVTGTGIEEYCKQETIS